MPRPALTLSLTLAATLACRGGEAPPSDGVSAVRPSLDLSVVADVIVDRMAVQPGEKVLLVARPGRFDALVDAVRLRVVTAGGADLGAWSVDGEPPEAWETDFTRGLEGLEGQGLVQALSRVDAGIMMPGATPAHAVYAAYQEVLRQGVGRSPHVHWAGAYALDGSELAMDPERDALYQEALVRTDWNALEAAQVAFQESMRGGTIRVTTPEGTDLSFQVGNRPVSRQDGNASGPRARSARTLVDREVELPAGVVRVAPVEETVHGRIVFPPSDWGGTRVEGLTLLFDEGVATGITANRGGEGAIAEIDAAGPTARSFREFALGFNPLLAIPAERPWIPYYGYGAGVVRLSLGDNTELGGAVGGGYVRWNFFTDATVTVDGVVWVEGGRLLR